MNSGEFRMHGHDTNGHEPTRHDTTASVVPVHITAGLAGSDQQHCEATALPHRTDVESAMRAGRLALV